MTAFLDWLNHRTGYRDLVHEALYERIPGGSRWRYVWGSTLVFTFTVQVITGVFLWMAYSPSSQTAWESVFHIQHSMQGGWLLRGLHHFTAQAMVVLLALHLMQVVIDGAYRAPREVNFWIGLILMLIVLGLSLTGYLLPWDQKGYWATRVATNLMSLVPLVGKELQSLVVGGSEYGHHTLTRFFALHAGVLPGLLVLFLVIHVKLFRRHGICAKVSPGRPDATFWPDQVLKDAVACLAVLAVVLLLVIHFDVGALARGELSPGTAGADLAAPADSANVYDARPEWYFLFLFQFLKLFEGTGQTGEFLGAIVVPGAVVLVMFLMPLVGRWKLGHRFNILFTLSLLVGIGFLTVQALREDRDNPDYQLAVRQAHQDAERARVLAGRAEQIPPEGALALVRDDPKTQGPRLFGRYCAACHTHVDPAAERTSLDEEQLAKATAPNLFGYGSRAWLAGLLDPKRIVGPHYFGGTKHKEGEMVTFVRDELKSLPPERVAEVVAALSAEAALPAQRQADQRDQAQILAGAKVIKNEDYCGQCHHFHDSATEIGAAPDLTGYASRDWLAAMIANPAHERFYSEGNDRMPKFAEHGPDREQENQLNNETILLIADWLRGDYYEAVDGRL